jgi:hypothetical protein
MPEGMVENDPFRLPSLPQLLRQKKDMMKIFLEKKSYDKESYLKKITFNLEAYTRALFEARFRTCK